MSKGEIDQEIVHGYFGLSYAHYLVLPRTALQSMPNEWQRRLINCMKELDEEIDWKPSVADYEVILRGHDGKMISITNDPLNDYERGRRKVVLKSYITPIKNDGSYFLNYPTSEAKYPEIVYPFEWNGIQLFVSQAWYYSGFSDDYFKVTEKSTGYAIGEEHYRSVKEAKNVCIEKLNKKGIVEMKELISKAKEEVKK